MIDDVEKSAAVEVTTKTPLHDKNSPSVEEFSRDEREPVEAPPPASVDGADILGMRYFYDGVNQIVFAARTAAKDFTNALKPAPTVPVPVARPTRRTIAPL